MRGVAIDPCTLLGLVHLFDRTAKGTNAQREVTL
jgi:hypothetical protein